MRKKSNKKYLLKMAQTILIKCCGFIVHSNPNNMALFYPGPGLEHRSLAFHVTFLRVLV